MTKENFITIAEEVPFDFIVWAVPIQSWEPGYGEETFRYEVTEKDSRPYVEGETRVHEGCIPILVPAGINLVERAVATLRKAIAEAEEKVEEKIKEEREQLARKTADLEEKIKALTCLTYDEE